MSTTNNLNPLLSDWSSQPFHLPPFKEITTDHFAPALEAGMQAQLEELQAIIENPAPPSFETVILPYDAAGHLLDRVLGVFSNLCSSLNTEELQQVQTSMSPILSKHSSKAYTLPGLFDKIDAVYQARLNSSSSSEQIRLIERIRMDFTRQGAAFSVEAQHEYADIKAQLATLTTQFEQNLLKDESTYELVIKNVEDLKGCPESLIQAAKQAATERHKADDEYVITLSRSLVEPFLVTCDNRDLRKTAWEAWTNRGQLDKERDNISIAQELLKLRQRQAQLHGYKTFAEYQCVDRMAKTPQAVMKLLEDVWERAKVSADKEREALEEYVKEAGMQSHLEGGIQPWDWRYVAEKVRKTKYDFDETLLKPYFSLDSVRKAMFAVSGNLFGLEYVLREDIETYHPDVQAYEVRKGDQLIAIFLHDNFSRQFKSSGAWMSEYRSQTKNLPSIIAAIEGIPVVSNNNNLAKGSSTTLLSHDDALTMFHEFGHAHHGMLSDATYGRLASTNVLTDFVELPSQLMEHWFSEREVLQAYARHVETGEPVPEELLNKLKAAESFNQGFDTIEYTSCALMDMAMHQLEDYDNFDLVEFEKTELERLGMPQGIVMRHRPAHFAHLFASNYYAAGYYVYLWAEVLDADAFGAFTETGNIFDPETAEMARKFIYSAGNTVAPDELFRQFRGRDPDITFMLKKKGLM
jgi:peptidyl-dipeptidase Dcp